MKTNLFNAIKCFSLTIFILAGTQIYFSCSPKITALKTMTFTDVENEFHFAKPLPESSKQLILKRYGSVQNYHDSIIARRKNPYYKNINMYAYLNEADSTIITITRDSIKK